MHGGLAAPWASSLSGGTYPRYHLGVPRDSLTAGLVRVEVRLLPVRRLLRQAQCVCVCVRVRVRV